MIHAIGDDDKAHREIERLLDELKGELIFESSEGYLSSVHEIWSVYYLRSRMESNSSISSSIFEDVCNSLFRVVDTPSKRKNVASFLGKSEILGDIGDKSDNISDFISISIVELGKDWPQLADLFKVTSHSKIEFPTNISNRGLIDILNIKGEMFVKSSDIDFTEEEYEELLKISEDINTESENAKRYAIVGYGGLGMAKFADQSYQDASKYFEKVHSLSIEHGFIEPYLKSQIMLANIATKTRDFKTARILLEDIFNIVV